LKLTPDDTTETFLTEVLKKYQIKNDIALYRLSINSGINLLLIKNDINNDNFNIYNFNNEF